MSPAASVVTDTVEVSIAPGRTVAVAWTRRAQYRLATVRDLVPLEAVRDGRGFAFLCQHVWAMLAREHDRRRWATPEDVAEALDPTAEPLLLALWRPVWRLAYGIDMDAPAPAVAEDGAPAGEQRPGSIPKQGTGPMSPGPGSSSA